MRVCAELCADTHAITREDQDNYAIQSFERGIAAQEGGAFTWEIVPVEVSGGRGKPSTVIDKYEGLGKFDAAKFQGERRFCYCWQCFQYKVNILSEFSQRFPVCIFLLTCLYRDRIVNYFL